MTDVVEKLLARNLVERERRGDYLTYGEGDLLAVEAAKEIEHLRQENSRMRMTYGSDPLFDEQRVKVVEQCAKVAELRATVFGGEPATPNEELIVKSIVAAIRGLK